MFHTLLFFVFYCHVIIHSTCNTVAPGEYATRIGGRCGLFQFDCDLQSRTPLCIPLSAVRDCRTDCPNMSDEWCGDGKVLCDVDIGPKSCGKCVHPNEMTTQCLDRKWQHLCSYQGTIKCAKTMNCVFPKWLMDGKNDCGDGSDEDVCGQGLLECGKTTVRPQTTTEGIEETTTTEVITKNKSVNKQVTTRCEYGEFRCTDGGCIEVHKVLDGSEDCADASDENYCEMNEEGCTGGARCSFQRDVVAFACGCPKGFTRSENGICKMNEDKQKL